MNEQDLYEYEFYDTRPGDNQVIIALAKHFDVPPQNICRALDIDYITDRSTHIMSNITNCFIVSPIEITERIKANYDADSIRLPGCIVQITSAKEAIQDTLTIVTRLGVTERIRKELLKDYQDKLINLAIEKNIIQEKRIGYYTKLESKIPMYYFIKNSNRWFRFRDTSDKEFLYKQDDILNCVIVNPQRLAMSGGTLPQLQEATAASSQPTTEDTIREDLENLRRYINRTMDVSEAESGAMVQSQLAMLGEVIRFRNGLVQEQTPTPIHLNGDLESIARNLLGE